MKSFEPFEASIDDQGRAYIDIKIYKNDREKSAVISFKYDSGADITTISLGDLAMLGYSPDEIIASSRNYGSTSMADGETHEAFALDLSVNSIMGQVFPDGFMFPFACLTKREIKKPIHCKKDCELAGCFYAGFRSLLGNDILSAFDIISDRKNGRMVFTKLNDQTPRNDKYPHCKLNEIQREAGGV